MNGGDILGARNDGITMKLIFYLKSNLRQLRRAEHELHGVHPAQAGHFVENLSHSMIKFFGLAIPLKIVVAASANPTLDIALLNPSSYDRPASYLISIVGSSWHCVS